MKLKLNANLIVQNAIQIKNGIMKPHNLNAKTSVCARKIIARILAGVLVRVVSIQKV